MRCPHCAGEIPSGSRFCGICGHGLAAADGPSQAARGPGHQAAGELEAEPLESQMDSVSLFELPASRAGRRARMALILVLDAILAGAGVVMLLAYLDSCREVGAASSGASGPAREAEPPR